MVYIASPLKNTMINRLVAEFLSQNGIDVFLPERLNLNDSLENLSLIGDVCLSNIDICEYLVAIVPYGLSTASEIGYAINRKRRGENIKIIQFNPNKIKSEMDAAICPFIDLFTDDLDVLVSQIVH